MILMLKATDDYIFHFGNADRIVLRNKVENRWEIWVKADDVYGSLVWRRFKKPLWYQFHSVVSGNVPIGDVGRAILNDNGTMSVYL